MVFLRGQKPFLIPFISRISKFCQTRGFSKSDFQVALGYSLPKADLSDLLVSPCFPHVWPICSSWSQTVRSPKGEIDQLLFPGPSGR